MAVERGYEQQTAPGAAPMLPGRDPREFGAGIGQAVSELGGQIHRQQVRAFEVQKKLDQDRQVSDWSHRFALHKQNLDGIRREARVNSDPGGMGHGERVRQANEAAREELFAGIEDPAVRRMAEQQWDSYSGNLYEAEDDWAEGQRVAKVLSDTQAANNLEFNLIRRSDDPKAFAAGLKTMLDRNALLNVDPATRDKLDRYAMQGAGVAFIQNLQDKDPRAARALLDSGEFDFLDPDTAEQLRSGSDVEIRRRQAAAEHAAAQQAAGQRDAIATLEQADSQGLVVPDEQWDQGIAAARAMGDESKALDLEGKKANNQFARIYQGQSPRQREQALARLKAERKPSAQQQREIKWLEDHRGSLDERFNSDPVAWAIENAPPGSGPPPGDIAAPGVMPGRVAWSRRQAQVYNRPDFPLLSKAEATQLDLARKSGGQGELQVLGWLDSLPDDMARQQAAREIAPDDKVFQHMALVRSRPRATIRAGQQALQANPQWFTPAEKYGPIPQFLKAADNDLALAMKAFSPADSDAVRTIGRNFVAGAKTGSGKSINETTRGDYLMGIRVGLGGGVRNGRDVGGLGYWGERPMVLPSEMVMSPAQQAPGVRSFELAVGQDMNARKVWPVNPDGKLADWRYIHPVLLRVEQQGGKEVWIYRWEDGGGRVVQQNKGGDFISRIENF